MNLDQVVANLVQRAETRFYGKYRAFVVENDDPEQLARLKLKVPSVLGNEVVTGWAMPCLPSGGMENQGMLFVPEIEAGVWVEFEAGDLEFPIWVGTFWSKPGGNSELPLTNDAEGVEAGAVQSPPTRKIIKTVKGHTLQFEDADGEEMVLLVEALHGQVIRMNGDGIQITDGKNGNTIILDDSGIVVEDKNGNVITLESGAVTIKSDQIKIGDGAIDPLVLGDKLDIALGLWVNATYKTHMHTGNMGAPTTPPLPGAELDLSSALSPSNKVE